ncbi:telomere binding protein [Striga asiatica]|uniref:Telomere binding protein n=1 Tax=Striga asiatica TaxID=4170 RepID=A0A5A7PVL9_STRAF|nr:telomere binding protein [Striga asiatica]
MVSKKRQNYGFRGYRAPVIPRAPRSIRVTIFSESCVHKPPSVLFTMSPSMSSLISSQRRVPLKHSFEDSKLCAFELLAAVAGKLLQESESSASSNVAEGNEKQCASGNGNGKGQLIDDKALKSDSFEHGSCAESSFVPEISVQEQNLFPRFKEKPVSSDVLEKVDCGVQLEEECKFNKNGNSVGGSVCFGDSFNFKVESEPKMDLGDEKCQIGELSIAKTSNVKEPNEECVNSNLIINSDSSVQLPVYREPIADASLQKQSTDVKLGVRDDDENSYRCKKLSTKVRPFKPQPGTEHRRIRRMMASKYRKVAPKRKGLELYNISEGMKSFYQYRKRIYTREWCQPAPIKKRKLSDNKYSVAYDQDTSSGSISNLPEKGIRTASDTVNDYSKGKDPHVTAILGNGIRVGLLFQGKKVRDDNRTLQQAGISQSNDLDTLGFTLEPCFTHVSSAKAAAKKPSPVLTCEESPELPRSPATLVINSSISNASVGPPPTHLVNKSDEDNEDNKRLISSSPESPADELIIDRAAAAVPEPNNALVALPPMNVGPLAVVPVDSKTKRCELSQRRIRRPFSVAEVEALVGAVEKLGTGKWRDVKIGAFENADHRTYVDLKDKWKTLVHTASISPHQRRGEPVPQELLDRVLVAHSYWSQHQSKQIGKHSAAEPLKIEDPREEIVGA